MKILFLYKEHRDALTCFDAFRIQMSGDIHSFSRINMKIVTRGLDKEYELYFFHADSMDDCVKLYSYMFDEVYYFGNNEQINNWIQTRKKISIGNRPAPK